MGEVIVTIRVTPNSPDASMEEIQKNCVNAIKEKSKILNVEVEPLAFGLKSLVIYCSVDDSSGGTDPLETALKQVPNVETVEVVDVRRNWA